MDDNDQKAAVVETPQPEMDNTEDVATDEQVDTQPTSEADVDEGASGADSVDTPESKWENERKSMSGKISALEREKNEYLQAKQMLDALDSAAANDPEFQRLATKKLVEQGLLDESVLEQLGINQAQPQDGTKPPPALEWAQQKMQEEKNARVKFFQDFEERHPDLREGTPDIIKANRSAIAAAAAKKMADGSTSQNEAFEFAYKLIMDPNQLVEEGKLQGIAQAQSATPAEGAASGGSAKSSGTVELTSEQRRAAKLFGVSEEEYIKSLEG